MPFIAFLGCDGSGKSAVLDRLTDRLQTEGWNVVRGHWRPVATPTLKTESTGAEDPHGKPPRGPFASFLKLGWLWIKWWMGWLGSLRHASRSGMLLFDRYHADLLVDPVRYRFGGPVWMAGVASRMMPQPDLVICLDTDPEVLLSRKQEVSRETLEKSRSAYLHLAAGNGRIRVVDASKPLPEVVDEIDALIRHSSAGVSDGNAIFTALSAVGEVPDDFALLRKDGRVLVALPANRAAAIRTLRLYQPQRWKARAAAILTRWIVSGGIHRLIMPKLRHAGGKTVLEPPFQGCLPGTAGVMLGSPEHQVKRAILCYQTPSGYEAAKVAYGQAGREVIEGEAAALSSLPAGLAGVPRFLGVHHGRAFSILRMPYIEGVPLQDRDMNAALTLLRAWISDAPLMPASRFPEWPSILAALNHLGDGKSAIEKLAGLQLKPTVRHGDFARWNLLRTDEGPLMALDWEWAHPAGMPGLDLVHFILQEARLVERLAPANAIRKTIEVLDQASCTDYLEGTGWGSGSLLPVIASLAFKQGAGHQDNSGFLAAAVAMSH
jgi:thymidylate kinase